ncbi:unnamed protein product [Trifolium pratense]|uniref:Uncharacterized protein n=1 Tax=Trifolium pratense TaxID=57577 RepID=A0ACB0M8D1_TRIPR|nr:unnamed protein product [Trifolium pratense]
MLRLALRRVSSSSFSSTATVVNSSSRFITGSASKPSLSIWRRKKELGKEGLIITKELKRLQSDPVRLDRFVRSNVSRLLKSDIVSVLFEFQRQDNVFLSIKALQNAAYKADWYVLYIVCSMSQSTEVVHEVRLQF